MFLYLHGENINRIFKLSLSRMNTKHNLALVLVLVHWYRPEGCLFVPHPPLSFPCDMKQTPTPIQTVNVPYVQSDDLLNGSEKSELLQLLTFIATITQLWAEWLHWGFVIISLCKGNRDFTENWKLTRPEKEAYSCERKVLIDILV